MRITLDLPDDLFRLRKTAEEIADDLRQAAAIYWLARGEIPPERAHQISTPTEEPAESFKNLLRAMPDVGDDADFARPLDMGREDPAWGT